MTTKLHTFEIDVSIEIPRNIKDILRRKLNFHYLGDEECNKPKEGGRYYEAKYPEKETKEFKDANWCIDAGMDKKIKLSFYSDGSFKIEK